MTEKQIASLVGINFLMYLIAFFIYVRNFYLLNELKDQVLVFLKNRGSNLPSDQPTKSADRVLVFLEKEFNLGETEQYIAYRKLKRSNSICKRVLIFAGIMTMVVYFFSSY